ncbi:hypothetical protein [Mycobacterium ostraviense]|uniref:hypothetical protein n=1 Tax=Mycobacterium ostraviense TaxID=2738409 RepID=UPI001156B5AA|nr:hypothetical protein [Mycobacterium ostraviense]
MTGHDDRDQLSAAGARWLARPTTDIGPATPPPPWCLPGDTPECGMLTAEFGGGPVCHWERYFGDDVWIAAEDRIVDGRVLRTEATIQYSEPPECGVSPEQARRLAAALVEAADVLDEDEHDGDEQIPAIYAHTSGPQRALLHAQLDDDANREALLAGMWPHLQAEAESQRLADDRDADGRGEQ